MVNLPALVRNVHLLTIMRADKNKIMKHLILILGILISLTAAHVVFAQNEGIIQYEVRVNMHRSLPQDRAEMKEMIPEFNVHKSKLLFRDSESLFLNIEEDEEDEEFGEENGPVRIRMRRPMNEYYFNFATARRVTLQEFLGKNFLIEDSVKAIPWKLLPEAKQLMGYDCKKATWYNEDRKQNVVVWYSDKLPAFLGPEMFNSLPGTVLEVDINDGERQIIAKSFSLEKLRKAELKAPSKGERMTEEAFKKMVEEQRKRMGGSGNIIIRN
jgi:GLPGLI family protein